MKKTTSVLVFAIMLTGSGFAQKENTLRVLCYNIYHGATMNGDFNLDTIASVIASFKPDLVAIQEVDRLTKRAKGMDLATELAYRTKLNPLFGRSMYFDGGEYGNGILAAYSFISTSKIDLPSSPGKEPRSAIEALIELPSGDTIAFVSTHFDHSGNMPDRTNQATYLAKRYAEFPYPVILSGDLNAQPDSEPLKILGKVFRMSAGENPKPTSRNSGNGSKIDYILIDKRHGWEVKETIVNCDEVVSDHCGYFAVLRLKSKNKSK